MSQLKCSYCDHVFSETEYAFTVYSAEDDTELRICDACSDELAREVLEDEEENTETLKIT
jgi:hypothetical protein